MESAFRKDEHGDMILVVDPNSQADYSISTWMDGATFASVVWTLDPDISGALYNDSINASPQVVDGTTYAAGELATVWIRNIPADGTKYKVTARATFNGGQVDDRSFYVKGREK